MSISSVPKYGFEAAHSSLMLADNTNIIAARYLFREFFDDGCWQRKSVGFAFVEVRAR